MFVFGCLNGNELRSNAYRGELSFFEIMLIHEKLICPIELGVMGRSLLSPNTLALAPSAVPCTRPPMFHLTSRVAGAEPEGGISGVIRTLSTIEAAKPCASRARHNKKEMATTGGDSQSMPTLRL